MSKNRLTLILSVYGYKAPDNIMAVLTSVKNQTEKIDVIISEQGENNQSIYRKIARDYKVNYILSPPDYKNGEVYYNIGRVRNVGAAFTETEFLYFSDADIVFLDKDYVKHLLNQMGEHHEYAFYRPPMYRLSPQYIQDFITSYMNNQDVVKEDKDVCLVDYDIETHALKEITEGEIQELINNQPHVCKRSKYEQVVSNLDFDYTKIEEFIWMPTFHYGGIVLPQDVFWKIGGYCESYYKWGLEDEDMHSKSNHIVPLTRIEKIISGTPVLHFEHERNYNNNIYKINRENFNQRQQQGIDAMIQTDLCQEGSFIRECMESGRLNSLSKFILDRNKE